MPSAGERGRATQKCHPAAAGDGGIAHLGHIAPTCHEHCQDAVFVCMCIPSQPGGMFWVALGNRHRYFSRNVPTSPDQGTQVLQGEALGHPGDAACPRAGDEAAQGL